MINKKTIFLWLFALFNPFLGIIASLISLIMRRSIALYPFAFSLALIYMYMPMLWDVKNNFYRIALRPEDGLNLFTWPIYIIREFFGVSYIFGVLCFTLIQFFIWVEIFEKRLANIGQQKSLLYYCISLMLVLTLFEYRLNIDLQRTALSVSLLLLAIKQNTKYKIIILLIASVIMHQFILIILLMFVLNKILSNYVIKIIFPIGLVLAIFFEGGIFKGLFLELFLVPEIALVYLKSEQIRFSNPMVSTMILILRLLSISVIFYIFYGLKNIAINRKDYAVTLCLELLLGACLAAIFLSFNDVFLERLYFTVSVMAIYLCVSLRIEIKKLIIVSVTVLANVFIHGIFTLNVVFSDKYIDVIQNSVAKISITQRVLYLPTIALLQFGFFGQSDEYILENARE